MKKLSYLLMLAIVFILSACSSNTPSAVAEKFTQHINDNEFEDAVEMLYVKPGLDADQVAKDKENIVKMLTELSKKKTDKDIATSIEATNETLNEAGDEATVTIKMTMKDGETDENDVRLKKDENGDWKVMLGK